MLCVAPDLRAVAHLGRLARRRGLSYPLNSVEDVTALLGGERLTAGDFIVDSDAAVGVLGPEFFPLAHEGEFLNAVHLALLRCRTETTARWRAAAEDAARPTAEETHDAGQ